MALSRVSLIALGAGAYLAFAVVTIPASVAVRWLLPETITLAAVDGTLWRGEAAHASVAGLAISDLRWRLNPAPLLRGRADVNLEARIGDGRLFGDVLIAGERVTARNLQASLDLATIEDLLPLGVEWVRGNARAEIDLLELVNGWPERASGTVRVDNLVSAPVFTGPGIQSVTLGSFLAQVSTTEESGVVALVNDAGGPLELEGSVRLTGDRRVRLDARVKPRADAEAVLIEGLKLMAPATASGHHVIELEQQL